MQDGILRDLQELIDFLGAHPELPMPKNIEIGVYDFKKEDIETAGKIAQGLKTFEKDIDDTFFRLIKRFGDVSLRYVFYRSAVCTKRVVGTKTETKMVPASNTPMVEKEIETEIIEWDCPTLLEGDQKDA
ncbi:hypothetical protein LCGC14_1342100 [marine sediment metagenome]|uniref:Uncharacterized protein n=1 Tax=marine sediment metagenome TaxID=412755 RepID=A0A0F9NFQ3_9ZZZZ